MKVNYLTASITVALAMVAGSVSAATPDFHGYLRGGLGVSTNEGGTQAGSEFHKNKLGRLGNEFDT
ncbi:MAG: carbohydrate porin, partial [Aeromonadaceae bacterium]